jgi:hypothetical protein
LTAFLPMFFASSHSVIFVFASELASPVKAPELMEMPSAEEGVWGMGFGVWGEEGEWGVGSGEWGFEDEGCWFSP